MKKALKIIISCSVPIAAGFLASIFTRISVNSWYKEINKPLFNPPDYIFAPVWTLLYLLIGISFFLFWNKKTDRNKKPALYVYFLQIVFNVMWTLLFFGLKNPLAGLIEIIFLQALIILTIRLFYRISSAASFLLIPYFAWVSFAAVLNFSIVLLN